ncbi:MAG: pyruvate, phosphate dikinase [Bdellovibrionales bacterium]|nr:pyruvate, phosphate dikinase [Bdellovibrionales bacterium]
MNSLQKNARRNTEKLCTNYFWTLDNEVPIEVIRELKEAVGATDGTLARTIELLGSRIPLAPKAYITSAIQNVALNKLPGDFFEELGTTIQRFEKLTRQQFGGRDFPLLLTVQGDLSGAIRNIGVHPAGLKALVHHYGDAVAYSLYVDFLESYSSIVLGCPRIDFRKTFEIRVDREGGPGGLVELSEDQFLEKVKLYQNLVSQKIGRPFNDTPERQLLAALIHCAKAAKEAGGDELFLKVQLHRSVFGQSTHGVAYTRNPFTGKTDLYGVYQSGAEAKKHPIEILDGDDPEPKCLRNRFPETHAQIKRYLPEIEGCFHDVMEAEFVTDEDGHLFFIAFDKANTTAKATVVAAVDLNRAGKINDLTAAQRIKPADVEVLLHPTLDDASRKTLQDLGSNGVTAAPGTAVGHIYFRMVDAIEHYQNAIKKKTDKRVILIANELLISDTPGLGIISGLVTKAAGIASHAAVMARANGIPCIVGYKGLDFDPKNNCMLINGEKIKAGTFITLEAGGEGKLYLGEGKLQNLSFKEGVVRDVALLMNRVIQKEKIPLEVRVNINNAKDAETGLNFGADGVGLCRTENMFMEAESLREIRNVIFTRDAAKCDESFKRLEEIQFQDFKKIFEVMRDRVVNIRLMDLPLHDFVPQKEEDFAALAAQLNHLDLEHLKFVAEGLKEHNPMLGLRACRFGLLVPQVYLMQIRAIIRAAYAVGQTGMAVNPGIMFPLVISEAELTKLRNYVIEMDEKIREELRIPYKSKLKIRVGSMVETPAASLAADQLARVGEFFAFGTNDLTQTTLGISRDDSAHYLPFYIENGIMAADPFKVLAPPVRELIQAAVQRGRRMRPDASYGICGEQGGDRATLGFCLQKGLDYVSASPFRVLPTRVAMVHEALTQKALGQAALWPLAEFDESTDGRGVA